MRHEKSEKTLYGIAQTVCNSEDSPSEPVSNSTNPTQACEIGSNEESLKSLRT